MELARMDLGTFVVIVTLGPIAFAFVAAAVDALRGE